MPMSRGRSRVGLCRQLRSKSKIHWFLTGRSTVLRAGRSESDRKGPTWAVLGVNPLVEGRVRATTRRDLGPRTNDRLRSATCPRSVRREA